MFGNDRVRHCQQCNLDVYNFSELTSREINQITATRTGKLCARFYQRADGTMLTENCPVGFRAAVLRGSRIAAAVLAAVVSIAPRRAEAFPAQSGSSSPETQLAQDGLTLEVRDPSGAGLPNAAVSLVNGKTGQPLDLTIDLNGELGLPALPAGTYELVLSANGFSSFKETNLTVPGPRAVTLQLGMLMGDVVAVIEQTSSEIPAALSEPPSAKLDIPEKSPDHRNALRRFFSPLIHLI
jgi:Carboxypeptidase regulatory-like domain